MLGNLSESECDNLLLSQCIGRIGYTNGKIPSIAPVTYIFDGKRIIGQTKEGTKLAVLRNNPDVCFEVDVITNMDNWKTVLLYGTFTELTGTQAETAREYLFSHTLTLMTPTVIHHHEHEVICEVNDDNRIKPIMYQIEIREKNGRFERQ